MIEYKVNIEKLKKDPEFKRKVNKRLREMDGSTRLKCPGNKNCNCICEEYKKEVALGKRTPCECGLYIAVDEEDIKCLSVD